MGNWESTGQKLSDVAAVTRNYWENRRTRIKIGTFDLQTFSLKFSQGWNGFPLRASRALISCKNKHIYALQSIGKHYT